MWRRYNLLEVSEIEIFFDYQKSILNITRELTFGNEEIEQRQRYGVSGKHVVSASPDAAHRHPRSSPNGVRLIESSAPVRVEFRVWGVMPRSTFEMSAGDAERCYQHRNAPQQEHGAREGEKPPYEDESEEIIFDKDIDLDVWLN